MTIKNTTSHEYIDTSRTHAIVEVTGSRGNGRQEKYQRKVKCGLGIRSGAWPRPEARISKTRFMRNVNPGKGMYKYNSVRVRVLKYRDFKRAS